MVLETTNLNAKLPVVPPPTRNSFSWLSKLQKNKKYLPKFTKATAIIKKMPLITGFSVNTHIGVVRDYNEDRVSIFLNA